MDSVATIEEKIITIATKFHSLVGFIERNLFIDSNLKVYTVANFELDVKYKGIVVDSILRQLGFIIFSILIFLCIM